MWKRKAELEVDDECFDKYFEINDEERNWDKLKKSKACKYEILIFVEGKRVYDKRIWN
jgi:hypothetical protein